MASERQSETLSEEERALLALLSEPRDGAPEDAAPRACGQPPPPPEGWSLASPTQHRLWLNGLRADEPRHGHVAVVLSLEGSVDGVALKRSLEAVVEQQIILATRFQWSDGWLFMQPVAPLAIEVHDGDEWSERASEPLPTDGPLFKADLYRGPTLTVVLRFHHLVVDGMGVRVLLSCWSDHYRAMVEGRAAPEPPSIAFAGYASSEHRRPMTSLERFEAWDRALEGAPSVLALPSDHARPFSFEARVGSIAWSETLASAVRALARRARCTLFMTLTGIYQVMLSVVASELDITVGTTISQRDRPETEPLVGNFGQNLLIRTVLDDARSVLSNLERVREAVLDAQGRSDVSIEAWHHHRVDQDRENAPPAFQCVLLVRPSPYARYLEMGQPVVERAGPVRAITPDLLVDLTDGGDRIWGIFEARADRFESAEPWVQALNTTAERLVAARDEPLGELRAALKPELERCLGHHQPVRWAWTKALGHDRFSDQDAFFDVGGTSWLAIRVVRLLERRLNRRVPLHWLYEAQTIARLEARLESVLEG